MLYIRMFAAVGLGLVSASAYAQKEPCPRPAPGSVVAQPEELRSHDGRLKVDLTYTNFTAVNGQEEFVINCRTAARLLPCAFSPAIC